MSIPANARIFAAMATSLLATSRLPASERVSASLEWRRSATAAECLDGATLVTGVEAALGRKVFVEPSRADIIINVSLDHPAPERWSAAIDLEDPGGKKLGHRELSIRASQCSAIDESLALVVSLMVDVSRESIHSATLVDAVEAKGTRDESLPPNPREAVPRAHWHQMLYLLGSARIGQLPGFGRGLTLGGELGAPHGWSVSVSATVWAPAQTSIQDVGAKYRLATTDMNLCAVTRTESQVVWFGCFGQQIGWLDSRAFGFDVNRKQSALQYDLTLRIRMVWWATSAVGLHLGLGAAFPLAQDEFYGARADGSTIRLLSRPIAAPLADFGLGLRFGQ